MRIDILRDDEDRRMFVIDGNIDLAQYDMPEDEKAKWRDKLEKRLFVVFPIKDGDETVH